MADRDHSVPLSDWLRPRTLAFASIPLIDLAPFLDGSDRQGVADRIGAACREVGFLYVANHGIPASLTAAAMAQARRFFALPLAEKMRVHIAKSQAHRGYFPYFEENNDPAHNRDFKEGFDIARDLPPDHPDVRAGKPLHGPNLWPADLPGFRAAIEAYYAALMQLAATLMEAFALSLRLPADYFRPMLDAAMGALRLLHYPPQPPLDRTTANVVGTGAHSDYGCLTILAQGEVGGLQVQNAAGDWVAAPPVPGAFVVNLGDQMARWTNDVFAATRHRVINLSGRERYSLPFFYEPNYDAVIKCLETCRSDRHPAKYADVVAGEYLLSRFTDTFAYRAAEPA
jgi:isopenicillin N synthase-like dioxygenase